MLALPFGKFTALSELYAQAFKIADTAPVMACSLACKVFDDVMIRSWIIEAPHGFSEGKVASGSKRGPGCLKLLSMPGEQ